MTVNRWRVCWFESTAPPAFWLGENHRKSGGRAVWAALQRLFLSRTYSYVAERWVAEQLSPMAKWILDYHVGSRSQSCFISVVRILPLAVPVDQCLLTSDIPPVRHWTTGRLWKVLSLAEFPSAPGALPGEAAYVPSIEQQQGRPEIFDNPREWYAQAQAKSVCLGKVQCMSIPFLSFYLTSYHKFRWHSAIAQLCMVLWGFVHTLRRFFGCESSKSTRSHCGSSSQSGACCQAQFLLYYSNYS